MDPGQLRPLTVGETLDAAIGVVRGGAATMAKFVSVSVLPAVALGVVVMLSMVTDEGSAADGLVFSGGFFVVMVIALVTQVFATGACTRAALDTYLGGPGSPPTTWRRAGSRFGPMLGLTVLMSVPIGIGMMACYLGGIALMALWACAMPALVAEGLGPLAALRRSQSLVAGRFWPTLGSVAAAYLLFEVVLIGVVGALFMVLVLLISPSGPIGGVAILGAVWFVAAMLTTPLVAAVSTVVYIDLRVRREGLDIQYRALAMDRAAASGPAHFVGTGTRVGAGAGAGAAAGPAGPAGGTVATGPGVRTGPGAGVAPWRRVEAEGER